MKAIFITPDDNEVGFEPLVRLRSREMVRILRDLKVEVWPIDLHTFVDLFEKKSRDILEFNPDLITAPNFNYFLVAANGEARVLDFLRRPVVALWDDPLGALANCMNRGERGGWRSALLTLANKIGAACPRRSIGKRILSVAERSLGTWRSFREVMRHPLLRHFSWDTGHIETVDSLGLLDAKRVRWYPIATYSAFLAAGERANVIRKTRDVSFCGNIYQGVLSESAFWKEEFLRALTSEICDQKLRALDRPVWDVIMEAVGELPEGTRDKYGLYVDRRSFWEYYLFAAWHAANTLVRLGVLSKIKREVAVYGLFANPESKGALEAYPNLNYGGSVHHFDELPLVYASTRVNVCICNGLVYKGLPSKLIDCLASGGFALTDPKEDVRRFFGQIAEKIFFRNVEELNSKIEYYLAHAREREEIVEELRGKITQYCTLERLFEQVLECVA